MDSLNNQLKQIVTATSRANSPTSSTTEPEAAANDCPICGGLGRVTRAVPVGHPDFGKSFACVCQRDILAARQVARLRVMSNLDVVQDKTFATFRLDLPNLTDEQQNSLRSGYNIARQYAERPAGWLLFQGGYGCGKTHLAVSIANHRLAQGENVLFITAPDLLDHLRSTYSPSSEVEYDEMFDRVRNVPLLVLDDLGAESATPWAQEKLFQLVNHRYLHKFPTVMTTNVELDRIDPRIRSRLLDQQLTHSVRILLPDFRRGDEGQEPNILSSLTLYGEMVFESFDFRESSLPDGERRNLRQAFEIALDYAHQPSGWLVFVGEHGCGKTHLAAAIANYRKALGEQVILVTAPDLLDYLRSAFNPSATTTFTKRFYELRSAPLLVIDQLDLSNASPWALEKIRQIADYRYLAHLPTVFTTTQELETIDPFLRSRLFDKRYCKMLAILVPSYWGNSSPTRRPRK
jgi:DNA replication protein DnaC